MVKKTTLKKTSKTIKSDDTVTASKNLTLPSSTKGTDFNKFVKSKLEQVIDIIQRTYLSLDFCKQYDIFSKSSIGQCTDHLHSIYDTAQKLNDSTPISDKDVDATLASIQSIFDKLSVVFSTYGTFSIKDIYYVVFGSKYNNMDTYDKKNTFLNDKLSLIEKYMIPVGYKNMPWTECETLDEDDVDKVTDFTIQVDKCPHLECFEPTSMYSSLHQSVYGVRVLIRSSADKKTICVSGIMRDIPPQYLMNSTYVTTRLDEVHTKLYKPDSSAVLLERWIDTITLKDLLIYSAKDFASRHSTMMVDVNYVKNTRVEAIVKKFFDMDLTSRRKMLIHLFTYDSDNEVQYIAYMLYDLIGSSENADGHENTEQQLIYESLPWKLKQYFKETMVNTLEFSQDQISKCDLNKISLEQQVLLMKADEKIKNRALLKLKEIKTKGDDQGNKSKQYLEALVRVPFEVYRKEPILHKMENLNTMFKKVSHMATDGNFNKTKYTLHEINNAVSMIEDTLKMNSIEDCEKNLRKTSKTQLVQAMKLFVDTLSGEHKTKAGLVKAISDQLEKAKTNADLIQKVFSVLNMITPNHLNNNLHEQVLEIKDEVKGVENTMIKMNDALDESIYGHEQAKKQIMKIVGQWVNGEQTGYCFGFEGSPGVGKTSLAKRGLAECLKDEFGDARPFSFIALGGSSNGSTLEGHNYTYVNSTWGKIVDVLMESKCMNPIIYIDELDKVSKTEQGREIIGILTHLIDTTQNDEFQDRFFSGIPFNLSKALFIFSYNDPDNIDRILLDRIHRIRFDNLSWSDKIVIVRKFVLPELNEKMGFDNTVELTDEVVKHIVQTYTMEPGVRKLKEILFDLYGEINLRLLNFVESTDADGKKNSIDLPVKITVEDLGTEYLKKYRKVRDAKIHTAPQVGTINGMWANVLGNGGIIPVEARLIPATAFLDLKLTGMQGDVMKESMTVAKTLAWSLTPEDRQTELIKMFEDTKNQGIHIHCPEGATPKDGPSAGGAITMAIFSLLNNKPIKNTVSMTGETNLQGKVTAIGGLDSKIMGSMRAGVKTILYPKDNEEDYKDFLNKYSEVLDLSEMSFHAVDNVKDAMQYVFE